MMTVISTKGSLKEAMMMPINEKRESNKLSMNTKTKILPCFMKSAVPTTQTYEHIDLLCKSNARGRTRNQREMQTQTFRMEWGKPSKDTTKNDDSKQFPTPIKQSITLNQAEYTKTPQARAKCERMEHNILRQNNPLKKQTDSEAVSLAFRSSFKTTCSQQSLKLTFDAPSAAKKELISNKNPLLFVAQPETAHSVIIPRKKCPSHKPAVPAINGHQQSRPSTVPVVLRNRMTIGKEAPGRQRGHSPYVLFWIPKRAGSQEPSGHFKRLLSENMPMRSPICCKSPVTASPIVTNRKRGTIRHVEGCRNEPQSATRTKQTARRCKSPMQRVNDLNMQNKVTVSPTGEMLSKSHPQHVLEPRRRQQSPDTRATEVARRKGNIPETDTSQKTRSTSNRTNDQEWRKSEKSQMNDTQGRNRVIVLSTDSSLGKGNFITSECTNDKKDTVKHHNSTDSITCSISFITSLTSNSNCYSLNEDHSEECESRSIIVLKPYVNKSTLKDFKTNSDPLKVNASPIKCQNPLFSNVQQRRKTKLLERKITYSKCNEEKTPKDAYESDVKKLNEKLVENNFHVETSCIDNSVEAEKVVTNIERKTLLEIKIPEADHYAVSHTSVKSTDLTASTFLDVTSTVYLNDSMPGKSQSVSTTKSVATCKTSKDNSRDNLNEEVWITEFTTSSQIKELPILASSKGDSTINLQETGATAQAKTSTLDYVKLRKKNISVTRDLPKKIQSPDMEINILRNNISESNMCDSFANVKTDTKYANSPNAQQKEANKTLNSEYTTDTKLHIPIIANNELSEPKYDEHCKGNYIEPKAGDDSPNGLSPCICENAPLSLNVAEATSFSITPQENLIQDPQSTPHNIYVTYMSPVIVESCEEGNTQPKISTIRVLKDIRASIENPKIASTKSKIMSQIATSLNTIKEAGLGRCEKYEDLHCHTDASTFSKDLLPKLSVLSNLMSENRHNFLQNNSNLVSNNSSAKTFAQSKLTSRESKFHSQDQFSSRSKLEIETCLWNTLDRLVECQEEVVNAFEYFNDKYEGLQGKEFLRNNSLKHKSRQDIQSSTPFKSSESTFVEKRAKYVSNDSYDDFSLERDRTYCVKSLSYTPGKTSENQNLAATRPTHVTTLSHQDMTSMTQITPTTASMSVSVAVNETVKKAKTEQGTRLTSSSKTIKTGTTKITIPKQLSKIKKSHMSPSKKVVARKMSRHSSVMGVTVDTDIVRTVERTQQKKFKKGENGSCRGNNTQLSHKLDSRMENSGNLTTTCSFEKFPPTSQSALKSCSVIGDKVSARKGTEAEVLYCPDALCRAPMTLLTMTAHLKTSHPRVPSAVVHPGRNFGLVLRPSHLRTSEPCIAAFLHVVDRLQSGPLILMLATVRDTCVAPGEGSGLGYVPSSIPSSRRASTSKSMSSVFNVGPHPPECSKTATALFAWIVELKVRSRCRVRVLRRHKCAHQVLTASSYIGSTVPLCRSQRLSDVITTGAYVVVHPRQLAQLLQDGKEVEVSVMVLPETTPENHHETRRKTCSCCERGVPRRVAKDFKGNEDSKPPQNAVETSLEGDTTAQSIK